MITHQNFNKPFFIGNWEVLPKQNRLENNNNKETHPVEPKVMQVLIKLAKNAPDPVSRAELFDEVWNGDYVSDDVLTRSVSILRKIFRDDPKNPKFIETIPKHGYALLIKPVFKNSNIHEPKYKPDDRSHNSFIAYSATAITVLIIFVFGISLLKDTKPKLQHSEVTPITSLSGSEFSPRVSPDGNKILFLANDNKGPGTDIYLAEIETGSIPNPRRLTESSASELSPVWSPEEDEIAFVRFTDSGQCHIYIMNRWNGNERRLTECRKELFASIDWSPDGERIAYSYYEPEKGTVIPAIYLYSLKTGKRKRLTNPSAEIFGDFDPRFSSDGSSLSFLRNIKEGTGALVTINLETGIEDTLFRNNQIRIRGYDWYDEQKTLLLSANRYRGYGLLKYDLNTQTFSTLMPGSYLFSPTVVQNQPFMKVIYEEWKLETNIYELESELSDSPEIRPLITSSRMDMQPNFSSENRKLAFLSDRSGKLEIWISEQNGTDLRKFRSDIELITNSPVWSPSGERLAFTGLVEGTSQIFIADLYSKNVQQFTNGDKDKINPVWSVGGDKIYYSKFESGRWNVRRKKITGGKETTILHEKDIPFIQIAPDGQTLYYLSNISNQIYAYNLESNTPPRELDKIDLDLHHRFNWRVTKNNLFYLAKENNRNVLYRYSLDTGKNEQVYTFENGSPGKGLSIAKNGKIYLVKVDRSSSDLVMLKKEVES